MSVVDCSACGVSRVPVIGAWVAVGGYESRRFENPGCRWDIQRGGSGLGREKSSWKGPVGKRWGVLANGAGFAAIN